MSEPSASNKSVPFELMTSLVPDDVWARSPLHRESIDRVLAAPKLLITVPPTDMEALRLTLSKLLDFAIPGVLLWPKDGPRGRFDPYVDALVALQTEWNKVKNFRNAPPRPPVEWLEDTIRWAKERLSAAPESGRPPEVGHDDFFRPLLAFYALAFGRKPSATPDGPTYRFMRALWRELEERRIDPPWPAISDAAMLARIKRNRDVSKDTDGLGPVSA